MKPKARTIKRQRAKGLGGRHKTGRKVEKQRPDAVSRASGGQPESSVRLSKTATIRTQVTEEFAQDIDTIVIYGGLWNNPAEFARDALRRERDKRIHAALRKKKEIERVETGP